MTDSSSKRHDWLDNLRVGLACIIAAIAAIGLGTVLQRATADDEVRGGSQWVRVVDAQHGSQWV